MCSFSLGPFILAAYRPYGPFFRTISVIGNIRYIHLGIIVFRNSKWYIYHASKEKGAVVLEPFNSSTWEIDLFRLVPQALVKLDVHQAAKTMQDYLGKVYGWSTLFWTVSSYLPIFGKRIKYRWPDSAIQSPTCSALVSLIMRSAGLDPCPDFSDVMTTPDDIVFCGLFEPFTTNVIYGGKHELLGT